MKKILPSIALLLSQHLISQVGINTVEPNAKAVLELKQNPNTTAKGFMLTRLTDAEMDSMNLQSSDEEMIIYNKTQKKFLGWDGNQWLDLGFEIINSPPYFLSNPYVSIQSNDFKNVGATMTSVFTLTDADGADIPNLSSAIIWNRADNEQGANAAIIDSENNATYTTNSLDVNRFIQSCVTPISSTGASPGVQRCSQWFGPFVSPTSDLPYTQSFESTSGYVTSVSEAVIGNSDYFIRTDGTNINATFNGDFDGAYFFAAQDIDAAVGSSSTQTLTIPNISIVGNNNIKFAILIAEDDDGNKQDWDNSDYMHIQYRIDGGPYQNLIWVENKGGNTNKAPFIDTDFDGEGDGDEITDTWTNFTADISGTGTNLDIKITFNVDAGDEDIAIDNIRIYEN